MRICPGCKVALLPNAFSNPKLPCRPCQAARTRRWYAEHAALVVARVRQIEIDNPDRKRLLGRVRKRVADAVRRGDLIKPDHCENGHEGPVEAAHYDYSEPLRVRWLCRSCHRLWDRQQPKYKEAL